MSKVATDTKPSNPSNNEIREDILKLLNENTSNDVDLLLKLREYLNKQQPEFSKKDEIKNSNLPVQTLDSESNIETSAENEKQTKEKKKIFFFKKEQIGNNENQNIDNNNNFLKKKRYKFLSEKNKDEINENNELNDNCTDNLPSYLKLNEIIKKYGFQNVLRSLYKPFLDTTKSLDRSLQKILDSEGTQKLTFMLLNIHCTIGKCRNIESNLEEEDNNNIIDNNEPKIEERQAAPALVTKNSSSKNIIDINHNDININNDNNNDNNNIIDNNINNSNISNNEVKLDLEKEKNNDNNNNIPKGNSSRFRKELGLGVHFHKDENDNIYKYCLHHFLGETRAIFYCSDKQCKSIAKYDVETKVFTITIEHSKPHSQHNYILNFDTEKKDKIIFLDFKKKNYKEGQVFRKGEGKRIVQWYNC